MTTKPTHNAMQARELPNDKTEWIKVGVAWQHSSSIVVKLYSVPLDGKVVLIPTEK